MTEKELHDFLLTNFSEENEKCEWKEFKNLKNSFSGKPGDDVVSYVCAVCNMYGGHIVIGVEDHTLNIVGTDTPNCHIMENRQLHILQNSNSWNNAQTFRAKDWR